MKLHLSILFISWTLIGVAQVDTITTSNGKLSKPKYEMLKHSYLVYSVDGAGNHKSTSVWDRELRISNTQEGPPIYNFGWKVYSSDSLIHEATGICKYPSLAPTEYVSFDKKRQKRTVKYNNEMVTIDGKSRKTQHDTTTHVQIELRAFAFPMDLEILGLLPIKKVNQVFAIPFYEPGSTRASYYTCTITGKENITITEGTRIKCWVLRLDYSKTSYANFWIAETSREIVKMIQPNTDGFRYKIKLY